MTHLCLQLRSWAKLVLEKCGCQYGGWDVKALGEEVNCLERRLAKTPSPIVLCHNDLNHLNLLVEVSAYDGLSLLPRLLALPLIYMYISRSP